MSARPVIKTSFMKADMQVRACSLSYSRARTHTSVLTSLFDPHFINNCWKRYYSLTYPHMRIYTH